MKNLENSSATPLKLLIPKWLIWSLIIVSFLGFLDASYLTIAHYTGSQLNCSIIKGCDQVTTSVYSEIFGIPVALLGMFYYLTVLLLTLFYFDSKNQTILKLIFPLTCLGLIASAWFMYAQFFLIKALCQYCIVSAITSTALFILGILTLHATKSRNIT